MTAPIPNNPDESAEGLSASTACSPQPDLGEVQKALSAFTIASRRVEEFYQHLDEEVQRLTGDLQEKNRELEHRIEEKQHLQAILLSTLQSLTSGVLAVGHDGIIVVANPVVCEIFGMPVQEIAGKSIAEFLAPVEQGSRLLRAFGENTPDGSTIEWAIEANGHRRKIVTLSAVRAPAPYDEHLAGLLLAEDVTELRRLEQNSVLQSRLEGIGEMAVNLAHEIRNPLGTISLFASSLAHELADDESLGDMARSLVEGVKTLEHVVTGTLDFAKPRRLSFSRIDLAETLADALIYIEHPRAQKNIDLKLDLQVGIGPEARDRAWIAGDAEQLRQVFLNLALNALQSMEEGQSLEVALHQEAQGGWAVEIKDQGVGIQPEDLERIFDPFFTTKEKGSGIGLAVVHRVVSAHGAQIEVNSKVGEGTSFRILFSDQTPNSEV